MPIWLNADIVEGPGSPGKPPVQASLFLNKLRSEFNDFTLSLGWSTSTSSKQSYRFVRQDWYTTAHEFPLNFSFVDHTVILL